MEYVNSYTPPQVDTSPVALPDPNQPYDLNFCFPVKMLETDRVKVVPFLPHVHAKAVYEAITKYPQVMHFMPWPEFATQRAFEEHVEIKGRREPSFCLFVTLNKEGLTKEDEEDPDKISNFLLGTIAYCNASRALATVEIGFIIVLPPYQRTHVSSHAIGLMMQYALDLPKDGGLGVRRCQWQAHASNEASVRAGMRLGFKMEGVIRFVLFSSCLVLVFHGSNELGGNDLFRKEKNPARHFGRMTHWAFRGDIRLCSRFVGMIGRTGAGSL
ncbi:hypothetical protein FRC08_005971 [Ceratobasidium sp. 394]|nr:hypothetical protein FRC08_005971 [Ceratobasidium sp. 394]